MLHDHDKDKVVVVHRSYYSSNGKNAKSMSSQSWWYDISNFHPKPDLA